ncbi:AsnC family transcriptional regulator [Actinoplanes sp. N902-109]|uniref:AsnC family transcriptional regulator n=1 Tax=Actinoplanes sp. (strain N902-109) TaxID=649831 RepID=UPI00032950E6|nr:AsnC family transcriptional regulator [Actinoplanes sp. N902-109]AGL19471.1 putative transcriptional regulatory protein [Actinoplanes sp. N902-109]
MPARTPTGSTAIDRLDRLILHGLTLAPRVPFARLAAVLAVSEQTVARRYQRMRTHGIARVFGIADYHGMPGATSWAVRLTCRPGTAAATADALARRTDTSWVAIGAGGAELTCSVAVADGRPGLLDHLPRAANVLSLSAHQVLHRFVGRGETDWILAGDRLAADQRRELEADLPAPAPAEPAELTGEDRPLLVTLAHDGRASFAQLATATGWTQRRVALRMAALTAAGLLRFDTDIAVMALGFRSVTTLWFTVAPHDLAAVGARLADHQQLAYAAAVTGSANLMANAVFADAGALYRYLTTEVAAIAEVQNCEAVPLLTRVKQAVTLVDGGVLRGPVV